MPFSPSDFDWWVWLLFGAGAYVACLLCYGAFAALSEKADAKAEFGCLMGFIGFSVGLAGTVCWIIGIVRFVKWIWES